MYETYTNHEVKSMNSPEWIITRGMRESKHQQTHVTEQSSNKSLQQWVPTEALKYKCVAHPK